MYRLFTSIPNIFDIFFWLVAGWAVVSSRDSADPNHLYDHPDAPAMTRVGVFAVVLLVVLAGCAGAGTTVPPTESTANTTPDAAEATTSMTAPATTTPDSTPTTTTTTVAPSTTPWGKETVTVAVQNYVNESRDFQPLVRQSLSYWEGPNATYGTYQPDYEFVEDPADAMLVIRFVGTVYDCDSADVDTTLGCAPLLTPGTVADDTEIVRVRGGYVDATTLDIIKHELGHTLGLRHGDEPTPLMAAIDQDATRYAVTNATDRANPWEQKTLDVYLDAGAGWSDTKLRIEAQQAIDYYNGGAGGWSKSNVTLRLTDDRASADIVIRADANNDLGFDEGGYAWRIDGTQLDSDPAHERYTNATLTLGSVRKDAGGWYVGTLLGYSLGAENQSDLPAPFADPDDADDRWFE